jgi:hypothetical protein
MTHLDKNRNYFCDLILEEKRTRATPPAKMAQFYGARFTKRIHTSLRSRREETQPDFFLSELISKLDDCIPGSKTDKIWNNIDRIYGLPDAYGGLVFIEIVD